MGLKSALTALLAAVPLGLAHPGEEHKVYQHRNMPLERKSLSHCNKRFEEPEFMKRTVDAHVAEIARIRKHRGLDHSTSRIKGRDYISVSKVNHKSNLTVAKGMDLTTLFKDYGACMLMPAVDQGRSDVKGEQIRQNITDGEGGIPLTLAIQVVDYKTCDVVPDAYVDIWSSNSTGMYLGVIGYPTMGDPNDLDYLKAVDRDGMRGVQLTDTHGMVTFDGLMPGHYSGRATHIHAIVYLGATKLPNNTITGGHAAHVGQIYWDQNLITYVNTLDPYVTNKMSVLPNTQDFLFQEGANGDDPIARYAFVSNDPKDGMVAWMRFGINQNSNIAVSPAAFAAPGGSIMNPNGPIAQMRGSKMYGPPYSYPSAGYPMKREAEEAGEEAAAPEETGSPALE